MGVLNITLIIVFLNSDMKKQKFPRISTNYFQVLGLHLSTTMTQIVDWDFCGILKSP